MREFALAAAWALIAIAVSNWNGHKIIVYVAVTVAVIISISSFIHACKNRASNPLTKFFA